MVKLLMELLSKLQVEQFAWLLATNLRRKTIFVQLKLFILIKLSKMSKDYMTQIVNVVIMILSKKKKYMIYIEFWKVIVT